MNERDIRGVNQYIQYAREEVALAMIDKLPRPRQARFTT